MALVSMDQIGHQLPQLRELLDANWKELVSTTALTSAQEIGPGDGLILTIKKCNENIAQANTELTKSVALMPLGYSERRVREYMDIVFPALSTP